MVVGVTMVVHTLLMVSDEGLGSLIMQVVVLVLVVVVVGSWASKTTGRRDGGSGVYEGVWIAAVVNGGVNIFILICQSSIHWKDNIYWKNLLMGGLLNMLTKLCW